jgi:isopentenyldiphosphate isomerase
MYKDECLVLDENDEIVGHENKYTCHRFLPAQVRKRPSCEG